MKNLKDRYKFRKLARNNSSGSNNLKYQDFLRKGGGKSGIYDVSNPTVRAFVAEYREFIPNSEIYKRDKNNHLIPVYKKR